MTGRIKYIFLFIVLLTQVNCSLDNKTGIWSGTEEAKRRAAEIERHQNRSVEILKIYSSETVFKEEILPSESINLSEPIKNYNWLTSNLNNQNLIKNIFLPGIDNNFLKKKIGKNKFPNNNVMSSPLFFDGNIILSDDTGNIFNITTEGKINWKKNIYEKIYKKIYKNLSLTIYKDKIYVSDNIGFVYSLDLLSGNVIWIKNHGIPIKSKIKIYENKIFLINQDNKIFCLDIEKGAKVWDIRSISSFIKSQNLLGTAISKDGQVVALTSTGDLLGVKSTNGRMYWSLNATGSTYANEADFFKSSDVVISDNDVILSTSKLTISFGLEDGYFNWQKEIGSTSNAIPDGKYIFLVSDNGYFVNLDRKSGKIIWSVNLLKILKKKKQNTIITGFILGSGKIYATTMNGYLIVCSAVNGKIEFSKKIADKIIASPIISNGSLFILTDNSKILGFN